ncbi:TrbG/VirB9 family P-type conjugative transfer protein [Castellaniella sp. UC4442_H9]
MKNLRQYVLALALASALAPVGNNAWALDVPRSYKADSRVRYATYNPENVIQLDAVLGVATMIELEPGEKYVYHVYGDSKAYSFTTKDNYLFFKPIAEQADTNLLVLTNRRSYQFKVNYYEDRAKALFKLVMRYPESEAAANHAAQQRETVSEDLAKAGAPMNWQGYTMSGDRVLAPIHAWDDGRQTWLQFAPDTDLPTVYRVTADGQETVANFHMAGARTMVLHQTSALWYLRSGKTVLALHNEAYGKAAIPLQTGTISTRVERVVIGARPAAPRLEDRPLAQIPATVPAQAPTTATDAALAPTGTGLGTSPIAGQAPAQPLPPLLASATTPQVPATVAKPATAGQPGAAINRSPKSASPVVELAPVQIPVATAHPAPASAAPAAATPPVRTPQPAASASAGEFTAGVGDAALMPKKIWISGGVTRMQFASGNNMPAVFVQSAQGTDQFVDLDIEPGNVLALHATAAHWHLVSGTASLVVSKKEP